MTRYTAAEIEAKSAKNRQAHARTHDPRKRPVLDVPAILRDLRSIAGVGRGKSTPARTSKALNGVLTLDLPWPPSVNTYWRHPGGGLHLISKAGRQYRKSVIALVMYEGNLTGRLAVRMDCYPPDARRRDLDNLPKSILDALQHAGVIMDDGDIDDLRIVRHGQAKPGMVRVSIAAI